MTIEPINEFLSLSDDDFLEQVPDVITNKTVEIIALIKHFHDNGDDLPKFQYEIDYNELIDSLDAIEALVQRIRISIPTFFD